MVPAMLPGMSRIQAAFSSILSSEAGIVVLEKIAAGVLLAVVLALSNCIDVV